MSVNSYLESLSSILNIADQEKDAIARSVNTINTRINSHFGNTLVDQFQFGSSVRRTMLPRVADPYSDVDYMIIFNNSANYKPQTFIECLRRFTEKYYSRSEIYISSPTVVLELAHINFELVPAYKNILGIHIPAPRSSYSDWTITDPVSINTVVDNANARENFQVKPTIRLMKYWNAQKGYPYPSYLLEQSIANAGFWGCRNLRDYFYTSIGNLSRWGLPSYQVQNVDQAKQLVNLARQHEIAGQISLAEDTIKRLLPPI